MKKTGFFVALILTSILFSCNSESSAYNAELSDFIIENYTKDAKLLYMHEIANDNTHPNSNDATLDEKEITVILEAIQAVYNLNIPEKDTIFNLNKVHTYLCYNFNSLSLKVDPEASEIVEMIAGSATTGNVNLDAILKKYNLDKVRTLYSYPSFPWLTVVFSGEYNMIPIQKEFEKIPSVKLTELNSICIGDGDSISLKRSTNEIILTFNIGRDDCPSGCLYKRYWEFKIRNNIAKFIKAY